LDFNVGFICITLASGDKFHVVKKILIMGLPGAGKTALARQLAPRLNAVHFNADEVRANVNKDLGFSEVDRIEQARRMGWLCDQVVKVGCFALADFICPTPATRDAFLGGGEAYVIFVDRIQAAPSPIPTACSCRRNAAICGSPPTAPRNTGQSRR
jgi:adenylylsulfate kinase-like enzyme